MHLLSRAPLSLLEAELQRRRVEEISCAMQNVVLSSHDLTVAPPEESPVVESIEPVDAAVVEVVESR